MKRSLLFSRLASAGYIFLGIVHMLVELVDTTDNSAPVFKSMMEFTPSAFESASSTLFDFYKGYSMMMGFLAICFGVHGLLIPPERRKLLITTALSFGAFLITLNYFPPLVFSFIGVCTIIYGLACWMSGRK